MLKSENPLRGGEPEPRRRAAKRVEERGVGEFTEVPESTTMTPPRPVERSWSRSDSATRAPPTMMPTNCTRVEGLRARVVDHRGEGRRRGGAEGAGG
jgi:hypothetical protein